MPIPGRDLPDYVPPPLPPPRHLPHMDGAPAPYESLEHRNKAKRSYGHSISSHASHVSGGSGYGSMDSPIRPERAGHSTRDTGDSLMQDEGYASYATDRWDHSPPWTLSKVLTLDCRSRDSFPQAEFGMSHNRFKLQSSVDLISDSMKKKLNPIRTSDRSPPNSLLASSVSDLFARKHNPAFAPTLSMPIHTRSSILDSPSRMSETPIHTAMSPRSAPFRHVPVENRSPVDGSDADRSPRIWKRNNSDDTMSVQSSYELASADDMEMDDASSLKRFHIDDAYMATGQKRRAASPPLEDQSARPEAGSRGSPAPRLALVPQPSSVSSYSTVASRHNSYMSTASLAPSSVTTAASFGCRSPGNSPEGTSPTMTHCSSPYATPMSLNPTPGTSMSSRVPVHARNVSATSPKKEMRKPVSKLQAFRMCDCCPKKPKKFDTAEQLQ